LKAECMQLRLKMLEKQLTLGQIRRTCDSCRAESSTKFPTKVAESSKLLGAVSSVKSEEMERDDDDAVKAKQSLSDHSGDRVDEEAFLHSGSHLNTVLAR